MYASLRDSVDNAFVLRQLVPLARELGISVTSKEGKGRVMGKILAKWGWRAPVTRKQEVDELWRKARQDVADLPPVVEKGEYESTIPNPSLTTSSKRYRGRGWDELTHNPVDLEMSPAQLFLFFRDSRNITSLVDFQKIRFSIVPVTQPDSADQTEAGSIADAGTKSILRASGSEGAIKHLVELIGLRWKVSSACDFSTPARRLSRRTRAHPFRDLMKLCRAVLTRRS
jgi:hypothetical protein